VVLDFGLSPRDTITLEEEKGEDTTLILRVATAPTQGAVCEGSSAIGHDDGLVDHTLVQPSHSLLGDGRVQEWEEHRPGLAAWRTLRGRAAHHEDLRLVRRSVPFQGLQDKALGNTDCLCWTSCPDILYHHSPGASAVPLVRIKFRAWDKVTRQLVQAQSERPLGWEGGDRPTEAGVGRLRW
jgi:hypothetical protein